MLEQVRAAEEARAAFYRTLASFYFKELDQDGIDRLAASDLAAIEADDALMRAGYADMAAYLARRDGGTRQELASDFACALLAAGSYEERRATPYESVFTSESGLLMQEARDDVYRLFCEQHLAVDEALRTPEDHLSFELEFMATHLSFELEFMATQAEAAARRSRPRRCGRGAARGGRAAGVPSPSPAQLDRRIRRLPRKLRSHAVLPRPGQAHARVRARRRGAARRDGRRVGGCGGVLGLPHGETAARQGPRREQGGSHAEWGAATRAAQPGGLGVAA